MNDRTARRGVLLVNLGTPDAPTTPAVRRYLREFLSDPRVVDVPAPLRFLLVNVVIAPFRAPRSAAAYRQVWTAGGAPLRVNSMRLRDRLREWLGAVPVELAMRYGRPGIAEGLRSLAAQGVRHAVVWPLYPQYADSSTGTAVAAVEESLPRVAPGVEASFIGPCHGDPRFLEAWRAVAAPHLAAFAPDHVLFSYHGLPERHVRKLDPDGAHCLVRHDCCDVASSRHERCYRAHCAATTRGLVAALHLDEGRWSHAFQSRLGRTPWLAPFTDVVLPALARRGVRRVAVVCPSFVADCLETVEEIGIRGRASFLAAGGEDLLLVPSLNDHPAWIEAAAAILRDALRLSAPA